MSFNISNLNKERLVLAGIARPKSPLKSRWFGKTSAFLCSVEERVMSVGDSGHGVNFEVLVRADHGHLLDGSPVSE